MMRSIIFCFLSLSLSILSILIFRKSKHAKLSFISFAGLSFTEFFLILFYGISNLFTSSGINESTFYYLIYCSQGKYKYGDFLFLIFLIFATVVYFILLFGSLFRKNSLSQKCKITFYSFILLLLSLLINPAVRDLYHLNKSASAFTRIENYLYSFGRNCEKAGNSFKPERVAHAGGGLNKATYTNSLEALDLNYRCGFRYFELDFTFTNDGKLVGLHDWGNSFERLFGYKPSGKLSLKELEVIAKEKLRFQIVTLDKLRKWMLAHPDAYIVTDVKDDNFRALKLMVNSLPDAYEKVIPQLYNPNNFYQVKKLGYNNIIWTLYRYTGTNNQVLNWVKRFYGSFAITMPEYRAKSSLPTDLKIIGIPSYVHTINTEMKLNIFRGKYGISEVYTDFLIPENKNDH